MAIQKRDLYEMYLRSNLQRLSVETLEKIVNEIKPEIEIAIEKEIED